MVLTLASLLPKRTSARSVVSAPLHLAVIIPAHNEELLIASCVKSLRASAAGVDTRIIAVAHNCSDRTAARAAEAGAEVVIYDNPLAKGKGSALSVGFAYASSQGVDATLVVDADSSVSSNLIGVVREAIANGAEAVQCRYEMDSSAERPATRLTALAFRGFNVVRPAGRDRLGLSAGIVGNGFAIRQALLAQNSYNSLSVVEDLEFHIRLVLSGKRVQFLHDARVSSAMPSSKQGEVDPAFTVGRWTSERRPDLVRSASQATDARSTADPGTAVGPDFSAYRVCRLSAVDCRVFSASMGASVCPACGDCHRRSRPGRSLVWFRFCRGYAHSGSRAGLHPVEALYASQSPPQFAPRSRMGSNRTSIGFAQGLVRNGGRKRTWRRYGTRAADQQFIGDLMKRFILPARVLFAGLLLAMNTHSVLGQESTADGSQSSDPQLKLSPMKALQNFEPAVNEEYSLGPGDEISLEFTGHPELSGKKVVGPDGRITLSLVGPIDVADKNRNEVAKLIVNSLSPYYKDLTVTVNVDKYGSNRVIILGSVQHPGVLYFDDTPTLLDVIARAGLLANRRHRNEQCVRGTRWNSGALCYLSR